MSKAEAYSSPNKLHGKELEGSYTLRDLNALSTNREVVLTWILI